MKKRTHYALARQIIKDNPNDLGWMEAWLFYFGSVFPDCSPLCVIRPHKYNVTHYKTKKRMVKLMSGKNNRYADCFRLGCMSHHVADYFTAPHNRDGVAGFCMDHRGYETRLHQLFRQRLAEHGAYAGQEDMQAIGFWKKMGLSHEEYLKRNQIQESLDTDYEFILYQITTLFHLYTKKRNFAIA
ncbi:MAG: zinc dependent phospholipase C family protein [Lachnospiraceae bacterium]